MNFDIEIVVQDNACKLLEVRNVIDGPFVGSRLERLEIEVQKYATDKNRAAHVICDGETVVGYVECKLEQDLPTDYSRPGDFRDVGHIARIGVREEYRGQKIGKQLLLHAESWLRVRRRSGSWLDYRRDNLIAASLYCRVGYRDIISFKDRSKDCWRVVALKKW